MEFPKHNWATISETMSREPEPGADFVWNERFLFVSSVRDRSCLGAGYLSEKVVWGIRSKTVRLWDPDFCLKPSISVYVRDRL